MVFRGKKEKIGDFLVVTVRVGISVFILCMGEEKKRANERGKMKGKEEEEVKKREKEATVVFAQNTAM